MLLFSCLRDLLCLRGADAGRGWTSTDRLFSRRHFIKKRLCVLFLAQTWSHLFSPLHTSSHFSKSRSPFTALLHHIPPPLLLPCAAKLAAIGNQELHHLHRRCFFPAPRPSSPSSLRRDPSHTFVGRNPRSVVVFFNRWFVNLGFAIFGTTALLHRRLGFGMRGFDGRRGWTIGGDIDSGGGSTVGGGGRSEGVDDEIAGVRRGWGGRGFLVKRFLENKHHQKLFLQGFGPPLLQKRFADVVRRPQTFYL
ncbi:hypothetical protein E3N88_21071 [Mikania micrantha]|uniref:Uncharacterized protein n=1 Tax=Mikania micrantha TaxID=192012 RepID=A0A5N6NLL3_9ASTR|nr:hypothetical protein E3N88_21071 [Mikania micrantha]